MSTAYSRLTTCEASKLQHKTNTTFKANTSIRYTSIRSNYTYNYSRRPKHELAEITTKVKAYTNTTIYGTRLIFQVFDMLWRIYRNSSESCASARLHSVSSLSRQLSMLAGVRFSGMLRNTTTEMAFSSSHSSYHIDSDSLLFRSPVIASSEDFNDFGTREITMSGYFLSKD